MKKFRGTWLPGLILAVIVSGVVLFKVSAQDDVMDQAQIDRILTSCSTSHNTLNQLHSSDTLLRVNMGQMYESIMTKLMQGFNGRVAGNDFNNSSLTVISDEYGNVLDRFRSDYIKYEEHLSKAIGIDCYRQPVAFYDAVNIARKDRIQVHDDVNKLNQSIDKYKEAVKKFEDNYRSATAGAK